jgi:hypothetical protein
MRSIARLGDFCGVRLSKAGPEQSQHKYQATFGNERGLFHFCIILDPMLTEVATSRGECEGFGAMGNS